MSKFTLNIHLGTSRICVSRLIIMLIIMFQVTILSNFLKIKEKFTFFFNIYVNYILINSLFIIFLTFPRKNSSFARIYFSKFQNLT